MATLSSHDVPSGTLASVEVVVSVIMPVFNTPSCWLAGAVRSALDSTGPEVELVIWNDGSAPGPVEWIDEVVHEAQRAHPGRVVYDGCERNRGPSAARNSAVALGRGRYLLWLDSDDQLSAGCVERMLAAAGRADAPLVIGQCQVIDGDRVVTRNHREYLELALSHHGTADDPLSHIVFCVQPMLVSRQVFETVGGFREDYGWAEVTDLFLRLVREIGVDQVVVVDDHGYRYHRRPGSRSEIRENLDRHRARALVDYANAKVRLSRSRVRFADAAWVGRSEETGAQHYDLVTDDGRTVSSWLHERFQARRNGSGGTP